MPLMMILMWMSKQTEDQPSSRPGVVTFHGTQRWRWRGGAGHYPPYFSNICCTKYRCCPVKAGERCSIWGFWYLTALLCVPVSIFFFVGCSLGGRTLTSYSRRKLLKDLKVETARLESSTNDLHAQVQKLVFI